MKYIVFIIILSLVFAACHESHDKVVIHDTQTAAVPDSIYPGENYVSSPFDTIELLTKLFDPDTILHKEALWEPDKDAEFNMIISDDGYCHTKVDTIMSVPSQEGIGYVAVFSTIGYDGNNTGVDDCHACGVDYGIACIGTSTLIDNKSSSYNAYEIKYFNKNLGLFGQWGEGGKISVDDMGHLLLHVSSSYNGVVWRWSIEYYYDITNGQLVFSFVSYRSSEHGLDSSSGDFEKTTKLLMKKSIQDGWNNIELRCKTERYDTSKHRAAFSNWDEYYTMNDYGTRYERVEN